MPVIGNARDLAAISPWRQKLLPAHFDGMLFHVESGSMENGRSIVLHEFPKRDTPYAEDMGRRAVEFAVRGYCIQYPSDTGVSLYMKDYTIARDLLRDRLETGGAGALQLPMFPPVVVTCSRYRLTEEERFGGYCVFDMTFVEQGASPFTNVSDPTSALMAESIKMRAQIKAALLPGAGRGPKIPGRIQAPAPAPPVRALLNVQR